MKISVFLTHNQVECWNFLSRHKLALEKKLPDVELTICETKEAFLSSLSMVEVVFVWSFQQEWFDMAPKLKWLVTPAAGKDYFQVTPPEGVEIDYCSFHGEIMAETVLAFVLAHNRGLVQSLEWQKKSLWPRGEVGNPMRALRNNNVVILGFGHIGVWIGRLLKPFGVRITGVNRTNTIAPDYFGPEDQVVTLDGWKKHLTDCDHLILALPRNSESDNVINEDVLSRLPERAALHNVGRGNAIDENALAKALKHGKLAAAFLDVFQNEPLAENSPLRDAPHCMIMPHVSACSPNYLDLFVDEMVQKISHKYSFGGLKGDSVTDRGF
ncbi:MAG: hypothetical protein JXR70_18665 [Spirochaetales bacterium]|nr:hypothetical protein [Spirochaetales bacterium]